MMDDFLNYSSDYTDWSKPTIYKGFRFKSRLEARWAVFFDAIGIDWDYERETLKFEPCYSNVHGYLPDFYFPALGIYGEVKASNSKLSQDADKIADAIDFLQTPCSDGLIILGPLPETRYASIPAYDFLFWYKGVAKDWGVFYVNKQGRGSFYTERDIEDCSGGGIPGSTSVECKYFETRWIYDFDVLKTMKAYDAAIHYKFKE